MRPITGIIRPGFAGEAIQQAIEQSQRLDAVDRICRAELAAEKKKERA